MKNGVRRRMRSLPAFTLVELITVVAIITILTMIAVPSTISIMRSSRIESANANAGEFYSAVQNFLTDQQIRNLKLYNTSSVDGVFPIKDTNLSGTNKDKIIFAVKDLTFQEGNAAASLVDSTDADKADEEKEIISGIKKYLGSAVTSEEGFYWAAQVDVNTYTVDWVLYCDQKEAEADVFEIMFNYVNNGFKADSLYSQVFQVTDVTHSYICQEYDVNNGGPMYVGQYPVPVKS